MHDIMIRRCIRKYFRIQDSYFLEILTRAHANPERTDFRNLALHPRNAIGDRRLAGPTRVTPLYLAAMELRSDHECAK